MYSILSSRVLLISPGATGANVFNNVNLYYMVYTVHLYQYI